MNLSVEDKALVAAARSGERAALRALAVSLDERLGDDDACLDGAVMAWRAVHGGGRRSSASMAAVAKRLNSLRRRLIAGRGAPASSVQVGPHAAPRRHRHVTLVDVGGDFASTDGVHSAQDVVDLELGAVG